MTTGVHPWFQPSSLVGATVQKYRLTALLGAGGFGAVYRTASPQDEPRAIKVLYPPISDSEADKHAWSVRATHFGREALAPREFSHPNIIRVFDAGTCYFSAEALGQSGATGAGVSHPFNFYVAELIEDGVDAHIRAGKLFTSADAARIGRQVCEALIALHNAPKPILHLDLNPGNIRLAADGRAVVTDFGVARIEDLPSSYVTQEGPPVHRGVGAPEQFRWDRPDVRTDVYQWGALMAVMMTCKYPRQGGRDLLAGGETPSGLAAIVLRCLEEEPARRFPDAAALKTALDAPWELPPSPPPGVPPPPRAMNTWPVGSPFWLTPAAPVVDGAVCCVWEAHTVRRVDPSRGATVWAWTASGPLRPGYQTPPVQLAEDRVYLRHGRWLSCLDLHGVEQWRHQLASTLAGAFVLCGDLVVLDGGAAVGLIALDARGGSLRWMHGGTGRAIEQLAVAHDQIVVVEAVRVAGSGGVTASLVRAGDGARITAHDLVPVGVLGTHPVRVRAPLSAANGTTVIWTSDLSGSRVQAAAMEHTGAVLWSREVQPDRARGASETCAAVARGSAVWAWAERDEAGAPVRGWVKGVELLRGETLWERSVDGEAVVRAAAAPGDATVFVVALGRGPSGAKALRWRLACLEALTGKEVWSGEWRSLPRRAPVPAPMVTPSRIYVQAAVESPGRSGAPPASVIEVYAR